METTDWIFWAIIFYIGALALTASYAFLVRRASLFEPISLYLFFVTLFTLPLPIRACITMEIEGDVSPYLPLFAPYIPISLVMTALALPIFAAGDYSRFARSLGQRAPLWGHRRAYG